MHESKQKILEFVKENGPSLPVHISRAIEANTIFAGAFLSELVANQLMKISTAKVGGSPMYYLPGQEEQLQVLRDHLSERPGNAFDILKNKNILRDKLCEPWQRVALREIKDFAVPLNVNIKGNVELFWKWYMITDTEARETILGMIGDELAVREEKVPEVVEEVKEEPKEEVSEVVEEEVVEEPIEELKEEVSEVVEEPVEEVVEEVKEEPKTVVEKVKEVVEAVKEKFEKQAELVNPTSRLKDQGEFYETVMDYFDDKNIKILTQEVKAKNREMNFMVHIPSVLGDLKYFVIARKKKKLNDADLSLAYSQGMDNKMPVIVLGTGEITKKAEKYIEGNIKGLVFKKLG